MLQSVSSLMHPAIDAPSRFDDIKAVVDALLADAMVPFGEQDGKLCFFSEKLNDIEQERAQLPPRSIETRRILHDALRATFSPLPATHVQDTPAVQTGLKAQLGGGNPVALVGECNTIQVVIELVEAQDYDTARTRLVDESRHRSAQHIIYLLGRSTPEMETVVSDIYRCQEIDRRYHNKPDQEVRDYCRGQSDRAERLAKDHLQPQIKRSLARGSFIFRGQTTVVDSLDHDVLEAGKKYLTDVARQVFDRYNEAQVRAEIALAEKFLRAGNLTAITSSIDRLGLVQVRGVRPSIHTDHKALVSIRDYIDRMGTVEGKRLTEHFTDAPFGWSQDTLRYLVASMLVAGEIKLKVSGREVTVNGQQAIEALKTNNSFRSVGVALREERPTLDVLARAADCLTDLIGDQIIPLEDDISKAATRHFPQFQHQYAPLAEKLASLGLPGDERLRDLNQELADVLFTNASDAPQRLGGEESVLYDSLKWASEVKRALENGLEQTVRQLQQHCGAIEALLDSGIPAQLKAELAEALALLRTRLAQEDFYQYAADFNLWGSDSPRSLLRLLEAALVARMSEDIHQSHNVSVLRYPLVCPAPYRRVVFDARGDTGRKEVGVDSAKRYALICLEIGTDKEQVHCLRQAMPTYRPPKIVKTIQSITARAGLKRVPAVKKQLWGGECWSKGYFIRTVGRHGNEAIIRQYVKPQGSAKTYKKLPRQDIQLELLCRG
jgi:REP element-mobilizing transposase RayT